MAAAVEVPDLRPRTVVRSQHGRADADSAQRVKARQRGGMGTGIMRRVMDEIHYARLLGSMNELRLIKYFSNKERT